MSVFGARRRLQALANEDGDINEAAKALIDTKGRYVQLGLERLLRSHESPKVRAEAAWALGFHSSGSRAVPTLLWVLGDRTEDTDVRCHAAEALGHLVPEREHAEVLAALLHALTDREPEVRFWAAFALGNLGDQRAIPALEHLAERDSESVPGWWSIRKEALDSIEQIRRAKV